MQRNPDLIRELLLGIEAEPKFNGQAVLSPSHIYGISDQTPEEIAYHLGLLIEDGYINGKGTLIPGNYVVFGLTMKGHDYLDSIRDPAIWAKTKEGAEKAGGFTLALLGELAKGFIKTKIKEQTGFDL